MAEDAQYSAEQPLDLIPVGLKEAALDSPTFRATAVHFEDQVDVIERWLDGYSKAASRLIAEIGTLESAVNSFLTQAAPPAQISEAVLDHDYTLLAMRRYGEGARDYWNQTIRGVKKYEGAVVEPIKTFLNNDLRAFKDARKTLDTTQKSYDAVIARYLSQSKTKEASSLREDAFQLHEARKAYLKASMDFCIVAPTLRSSLDQLIVRIFADQYKELRSSRDSTSAMFNRLGSEMERVRGWSKEMESSERAFKRELLVARRQIEESASQMHKPSRELHDYELAAEKYSGTGASTATGSATAKGQERGEKQGWLFMKTIVGKPARTVWSRRWFFVKNGIFGWLVQGARSGGVEESDKIGVLLCGVRPSSQEERRFCFEVKTKDTNIILQAETQTEVSEWISSFEFAKRKALEDPGSTENTPIASGLDPAFAISPPVAPEFAAKTGEGEKTDDVPAGLSLPEREGAQRASFDVGSSRRVMSLEREPGEGSRDAALRLMQKLDLKRGPSPAPSAQPAASPSPAGGIASLISASHNVLPVGPGAPAPTADTPTTATAPRRNMTIPSSSLAPSTLANPPAPTNLSHTAVVLSGERGVSLGSKADGSGMPGGIMANLWGSSNWGYVNRLGDEVPNTRNQRSASQPPSPALAHQTSVDDVGVMDGAGEIPKDMPPLPETGIMHRKTLSAVTSATETDLTKPVMRPSSSGADEYPNYYPLPLKAQHAQFKMLFPSVPRAEKIVLVFRATWDPNEQQEFPGRVYVTAKEIYFYSNHLGLVLITGVNLRSISEVTAAPGRDCDFVYLHLKDATRTDDRRRITVKVFLEPLKLLQRRLNFLAHNANSESPVGLEEILKTLIKMEVEKPERSSSADSWENIVYEDGSPTAADGGSPSNRRERNVKASLRIDGNLYGETARTGREIQKFQLPRQAVVYSPQGMQHSITREFTVSAKALFHVIFGDKSMVFQLLYCNRAGDKIIQTPWTKGEDGHWTRRFASQGQLTPMADIQTIDILNDHLCYVITNTRHPWRLPYSTRFHLTTKFVITHMARSRCKLAVFQQLHWFKAPAMPYIKSLIERQAFNTLEADALDLSNVAMDQVAKLGNHSKTNKAIEVFGHIGQQPAVPQLDANAAANVGTPLNPNRARHISLPKMIASDLLVKLLGTLSMAFDMIIALGRGILGVITAHTLLVAVLVFSMLYNSWYGYKDGMEWWQERTATKYMARLGVKPDPVIGKAVYLADIDELVAPTVHNETIMPFLESDNEVSKTCRTTFGEQLTSSTSVSGAGDRLHRSRDALAKYRHDLLVAIRVVNRVEHDVVLGAWEDWVRAEERKCSRVEDMLKQQMQGNKKNKSTKMYDAKELDAELGSDFADYCSSCRDELAGFDSEGRLI